MIDEIVPNPDMLGQYLSRSLSSPWASQCARLTAGSFSRGGALFDFIINGHGVFIMILELKVGFAQGETYGYTT